MDVKPFAEYFRFHAPREYEGQTVWTPFMGEVTDGCIYVATNEMQASVLRAHDDWEAVSKSKYNAQEKASKRAQESAEEADEADTDESDESPSDENTDESPSDDAQDQTDTKEKPDEE